MIHQNYLNLQEKDIDRPIYRIFSENFFFELFKESELILVRPSKWDDPFENFVLNSKKIYNDGRVLYWGNRKHLYAQCWSFKNEDDALWRIYSPDKKSIQVSTTPRKLFDCIYNQVEDIKDEGVFIGKVRYLNSRNLVKQIFDIDDVLNNKIYWGNYYYQSIANTLLVKRKLFSYENEVRIIYNSLGRENEQTESGNKEDNDSGLKHFKIDPLSLFDSITLDSRIEDSEFGMINKKIESFGFNGKISKSKLYEIPGFEYKSTENFKILHSKA